MFFDDYCGTYKINSLGNKRLLKTKTFGRKGKLSSEKKILAFFVDFSSVTNLKGQIVSLQKAFWQLQRKQYDHFCNN